MAIIDEQEYTKISINKDLHSLIKDICLREGLKMYHFEDKAVKEYISKNWSKYINNGYEKLFIEEK